MDFDNLIFVFNGPSAAGKTVLLNALVSDKTLKLEKQITATTRPPRKKPSDEVDGRDYYFLSKEEFLKRTKNVEDNDSHNSIIEYTEYPPNSGIFYGSMESEIKRIGDLGKDVVTVLDINGVSAMKRFYGAENVVSIYIYRDLSEILKELKRRELPEEEIKKRMDNAMEELKNITLSDYVIYNIYDEDTLIKRAKEIIKAEIKKKHIKNRLLKDFKKNLK